MRATPNLSLIEPKYTWMKGHGKVRAPPADIGLDLPSDEELEQIRRDRKHSGDAWTEREDEILYNLMKICPGGWDSAAQVLQRSVNGIRWRYYHCARPKFSHESANREEQRASEHKQPEESGTSSSCLRSPGESLIQVPEMEEVTTKKVSFPEFEYRRTDLRCNYGKRKDKDKLDPLFEAFRVQTRLPDGFMPHTMGLTEIPHGTLKGWRRKLAKDPTRDLLKNGHSGRSSVLDKDTERRIYDIVVGEIRAHRCVTARRVQDIANNITAEKRLQCKNGRTWLRGFLKRWNLSLRKAHLKRRPAPNDEIVAEFVENFELALFQYCHEAIINMDETSWHVFNGKEIKTVARTFARILHSMAEQPDVRTGDIQIVTKEEQAALIVQDWKDAMRIGPNNRSYPTAKGWKLAMLQKQWKLNNPFEAWYEQYLAEISQKAAEKTASEGYQQ